MQNELSKLLRFAACFAFVGSTAATAKAQVTFGPEVNKPGPALAAFAKAYDNVNDYTMTDTVSEQTNDGAKKQNRVYAYKFMKPHFVDSKIVSGPGAGSAAVWRGGDKVKGHQGGLFSALKMTVPITDGRATSLRGNTIDKGTLTFVLQTMLSTPGTLVENPGPEIAGGQTTAVELDDATPQRNGETKVVLYLSNASHLPVKRQVYAGSVPVLTALFTDLKTNIGLKQDDFDM